MVIGLNECSADAVVTTGGYTAAQIDGIAKQTMTQDALQLLWDLDFLYHWIRGVQRRRLLLPDLRVGLPVARRTHG